jgi:alpha-beta hydrolase superfamily lysophospholipase
VAAENDVDKADRRTAVRELAYESAFRTWAVARGMTWERLSIDTSSGNSIAYRVTPCEPPKAVLLALHGAGNDALFGWVGLFKQALLHGVGVYTFDLPGHGRFGSGFFEVSDALAAVDCAIRSCRPEQPGVPVHAIGVSLGGSVLLGALPRLQTVLASAILVVAPLEIRFSLATILPEVGPRTIATLIRERGHYGWTGLIPSFGPFKRDTYPLRLRDAPPSGAFGYVTVLNAMLRDMALERAASEVRLPCLLIYGDRDRVVSVAQGQKLAALLPSSTLQVVAGGTHLSTPMEPAAVERILSWIDP